MFPGGVLSSDETLAIGSSPYLLDCTLTVNPGVTLTVDPGVVIKGNSSFRQLFVEGSLSASGAFFTSWRDDTVGGDTDGGSTAPDKGDWGGIGFLGVGTGILTNVEVRYAGGWSFPNGGAPANIYTESSNVTITSSKILYSRNEGVLVTGNVAPSFISNEFIDNLGCALFLNSADEGLTP